MNREIRFLFFSFKNMLTVRAVGANVAVPRTASTLFNLLQSPDYAKQVAIDKFGFRAYSKLAQRREVAITHPGAYLKAKQIRINGGLVPPDADVGGSANREILYGAAVGANINGVAGDVAQAYADTLIQLYDAGADEATSEKFATAVAESLMRSKLAIVESEFPDIIDSSSEKNLLLNTLGTLGNRVALGTPKLKSITQK